jgi:mannitol/fructose-specific phosphotransferase system IIA component (Ntr-type)
MVGGISHYLHVPGFLPCMAVGFLVSNYSTRKHVLLKSFTNIEPAIYVLFFVLAGAHIDFSVARTAGLAGLAFIAARSVAKYVAPALGGAIAGAPQKIRHWVGLSLLPQAGISIGFVIVIEARPEFASFSGALTTVVLGAVVFFEIIGPLMTHMAIKRCGEEHKDRDRLLDFLQEEYILVGLQATDKWKALEELARFMHRVHGLKSISAPHLIESILARERQMSTGLGQGIAVPHAIIEEGPGIHGVIGVSRRGIDFNALDGKPVHLIVLVATPEAHYDRHLQVLAGIASIFGHDPELREQIFRARTPAEVHDLLQTGSADSKNVYLDE